EPRKLPSSSITRFEPTGLGAEPQVSITVASATPRPPLRQSSAALRMSSSRASIKASSRWSRSNTQDSYLRDLSQPSLGIAGAWALVRQRPYQVHPRFEIVNRPQFVDVGQHRPDALGARLETGKAQKRIEPDQPPAGPVQPIDLEGEFFAAVPLEPVGDQENDGTLGEHAPGPSF